EDMSELLLLLARATARQAESASDAAARQEQLAHALRLNELAEGCCAPGAVPQILWLQRADLVGLAGRADEAQRLHGQAEKVRVETTRDRYLLVTDQLGQRQFRAALPFLQEASRQGKDSYAVWMQLGVCYRGLGRPTEAVACYDRGIALWPNAHWG